MTGVRALSSLRLVQPSLVSAPVVQQRAAVLVFPCPPRIDALNMANGPWQPFQSGQRVAAQIRLIFHLFNIERGQEILGQHVNAYVNTYRLEVSQARTQVFLTRSGTGYRVRLPRTVEAQDRNANLINTPEVHDTIGCLHVEGPSVACEQGQSECQCEQ